MKGLLPERVTRTLLSLTLLSLLLFNAGCGGGGGGDGGAEVTALNKIKAVTITDLGTLGGSYGKAVDINDKGLVVGESTTSSDDTHGFIWQDGVMTDLGTLGGVYSKAVHINDKGQVIGESSTSSGVIHGFIWQDGVMTDLGTLGGNTSSAHAINRSGQVVGESTTSSGATHAFFWQDGAMTDLGTLGGDYSKAVDINDKGQVTGESILSFTALPIPGATHAFLWQNGVLSDLGVPNAGILNTVGIAINDRGEIISDALAQLDALGGVWQDGMWSILNFGPFVSPHAINDKGLVAGQYFDGLVHTHAFIWQDGVKTDLGVLGGDASPTWFISDAVAINDKGQVAGSSTASASSGATHAFIWQDGVMTDLGALSGSSIARAINAGGQVAGESQTSSGGLHAILWNTN